ncbi:MAG: hypothetical protein U9R69_01525, partial [Thermodesulfobacteriota bacterium]|nr:hypothetical protein [Thermodesulfobacteriota bacterium]
PLLAGLASPLFHRGDISLLLSPLRSRGELKGGQFLHQPFMHSIQILHDFSLTIHKNTNNIRDLSGNVKIKEKGKSLSHNVKAIHEIVGIDLNTTEPYSTMITHDPTHRRYSS